MLGYMHVDARGFWERQSSSCFDVRVCHPNAESSKDLTLKQIYLQHENEKKRMYTSRVLEVEQGTFTTLVFTATGGMADECKRYNSRLAEITSIKKGKDYSTPMTRIKSKVSFVLLRSALLCLRGSRTTRHVPWNIQERDFVIDKELAGLTD